MGYLLISEVSKKQDFIFKTNKLAENVGASLIIKKVTEELSESFVKDNQGEAIYKGGGKSLYSFKSKEDACKFTGEFSRYLLEKYPGLEIFITGIDFDDENKDIIEAIDDLYKKLAVKKAQRKYNSRQIGFGITEKCYSTNLPANLYSKAKKSYISNEIEVKLNNNDGDEIIKLKGYTFPKELDDLGRTINEKSYIAVVHIDGNKMGEKIEKLKEKCKLKVGQTISEHNYNYISELKKLSGTIKKAYLEAFEAMCRTVAENIEELKENLSLKEGILPIRPLILAGDDVCFISDARIGIECSKIFIKELNKYKLGEDTLHACAGISIVKAHYPFSKAYELAEQLCSNAKNEIEGEDTSVIDWHISQGEVSESIYTIREKYYTCKDNSRLNMRPIYLKEETSWRNYNNFIDILKQITKDEVAKGKIKELREVFREGKAKTEIYVRINKIDNLIYRLLDTEGDFGFTTDGTCIYYDAIEAMDFYIPLKEAKKNG